MKNGCAVVQSFAVAPVSRSVILSVWSCRAIGYTGKLRMDVDSALLVMSVRLFLY